MCLPNRKRIEFFGLVAGSLLDVPEPLDFSRVNVKVEEKVGIGHRNSVESLLTLREPVLGLPSGRYVANTAEEENTLKEIIAQVVAPIDLLNKERGKGKTKKTRARANKSFPGLDEELKRRGL